MNGARKSRRNLASTQVGNIKVLFYFLFFKTEYKNTALVIIPNVLGIFL